MVIILSLETVYKIVHSIKNILIIIYLSLKQALIDNLKLYGMIGRLTWKFFNRAYCPKCGSNILGEFPGEYLDFDADPERGGDGIPLCSACLGTGIIINHPRFRELGEKVRRIRKGSLLFQIKLIEAVREKRLPSAVRYQALKKLYNNRLLEISREGLKLVKRPRKYCLALGLAE